VLKLEAPPGLRASRHNDICDKCEEELAGAIPVSRETEWMHEIGNAIKRAAVESLGLEAASNSSPWDLLELNRYNGGWGYESDFGKVLAHMDVMILCKVRDWLEHNREEVVERYDDSARIFLTVRFSVYVHQMPPHVERENFFAGLPNDGLPIQGVAMRVDGKKWDLNIPVRAKLLSLAPRYFTEQNFAKALGIGRHKWRNIRDRMKYEGFTLDGFTSDVLWLIVRGKMRGQKKKK